MRVRFSQLSRFVSSRFRRTSAASPRVSRRGPRRRHEPLEARWLLAADIAVTDFHANGTNLLVDYDISGASVAAFNISVYRSTDGTSLDALLQTSRVTDNSLRQVGAGHRISISPSFADTETDYFLVVVVDASSEISEASEANNQMKFAGGVFLASNALLHVHGRDVGDTIVVSQVTPIVVTFAGNTYTHSASAVSGVRIRAHGGNDYVVAGVANKPTFIAGGDGSDILIGGAGNDIILGGAGNDSIYGMAGNDRLEGGAGDDLLFGGDGNDILVGESGDDFLDGGAGNDTYRFWGADNLGTDTVAEAAGNGTDTLDFSQADVAGIALDLRNTGSQDYAVSANLRLKITNDLAIENVIGSEGADVIHGNSLNNAIYGRGGDDEIYGHQGNDLILGEAGNDTLYGGNGDCSCPSNGNNMIFGGAGDDWIDGGGGANYIDGGSGVDDIVNFTPADYLVDRPTIVNFNVSLSGGILTINGSVHDDGDVEGLTIYFGGILEGHSTQVDEFGNFQYALPWSASGEVTAETIDQEGLLSEEVYDLVL